MRLKWIIVLSLSFVFISYEQVICPVGHFGEISQNIGQCLECPLNTYQPKKGQFSCLKCPDGLVTTTKGAVDSSRCTFGKTINDGCNIDK